MKTTVYQYQENIKTGERTLLIIGEVEGERITPGVVWHLTNYSCWGDDETHIASDNCVFRPNNDATGVTNHDIMFELEDGFYTAESFGFAKFATFNDAVRHLQETNQQDIKGKLNGFALDIRFFANYIGVLMKNNDWHNREIDGVLESYRRISKELADIR